MSTVASTRLKFTIPKIVGTKHDIAYTCATLDQYLQTLAATTSGSVVILMRWTVLLGPERMASILNQTRSICWDLWIEIEAYYKIKMQKTWITLMLYSLKIA